MYMSISSGMTSYMLLTIVSAWVVMEKMTNAVQMLPNLSLRKCRNIRAWIAIREREEDDHAIHW